MVYQRGYGRRPPREGFAISNPSQRHSHLKLSPLHRYKGQLIVPSSLATSDLLRSGIMGNGSGTKRFEDSKLAYCSGGHALHSDTLSGAVRGGPVLERTIPSSVEQKLLVPALLSTGVATTTYSVHDCRLQRVAIRK